MMNLFTQAAKARTFGKYALWKACQPERCFQTSHRTLKQVLTKSMRIKHEEYYKRIDRIPNEYEMIYKLPLHYTVNAGKMTCVSAMVGMPCFWLYNEYTAHEAPDIQFVSEIAINQGDLAWFLGGFVLTTSILYGCCHIITLRIYRHEKNYIAMIPSVIPRRNIQVPFTKGQVTEGGSKLLSNVFEGVLYKIKNRTILLIPERFRKGSDLFDMLHASDSKKYIKQ